MAAASSCTDFNAIYARARKLLNTIEFQLQELEQAPLTAGLSAASKEEGIRRLEAQRQELSHNINLLTNENNQLSRAVTDHAVSLPADKRDLWRKRAAQLNAETASLRSSIMTFMRNTYNELESRKTTEARQRLLGGGAAGPSAVAMDAMIEQRTSIMSSISMIDDMTGTATSVLGSLRDQRKNLKTIHKKLLDVARWLGLSSTVIRFIEKRVTGDKILVYGGMAVILLLIAIVWWFLRS